MSLFDVKHQDRANRLIQRALASERMPHAYAFCGPEGVGKGMLVQRLGRLLLCTNPQRVDWPADMAGGIDRPDAIDACGNCQDCHWVDAGTHPDYHRIHKELIRLVPEKESHKATALGIDVVRRFVIDAVGRKAARHRAKVFVIEEAEKLSTEAQNAMLKTLEEPPADTFIILLTSTQSRLLPTTLSRCQLISFSPLPAAFVAEHLTRQCELEEAAAHYLSRRCVGRLGLAVRWARQGYYPLKTKLLEELVGLDVVGVEGLAKWIAGRSKSISEQAVREDPTASAAEITREAVVTLLGAAGSALRDALVLQAGGPADLLDNLDQAEIVKRMAPRFTARRLQQLIGGIARTEAFIAANANVQLALENWLLQLVLARQNGALRQSAGFG